MNTKILIDSAKRACDSLWIIRDMFQFKLFCHKDVNIIGFAPTDTIKSGNFSGVNVFPFLNDTSMNFNVIWEDYNVTQSSETEAIVSCEHNILINQSAATKSVKIYTTLAFIFKEDTPLITNAHFSSPDFSYSLENSQTPTPCSKETITNVSLDSYYLEVIESTCDLFIDCDMSQYILSYDHERYRQLFDDNTFYTNPDRWFWNMCTNCVHPEDYEKVDIFRKVDMDKRIKNNITSIETNFRIKNSEAGYIWISLKVITKLSKDAKAERLAMIFRRLNNLQLSEVEYLEKTRRDSLTGLYNKNYGEYLVNTFIDSESRSDTSAFVIVDIDNFHLVNDTFGHMTGDEILKQFARSLESFFGQGNIIARSNGDKFFMLISRYPSEYEVTKSIDNFIKSMRHTHYELGTSLDIHCSAGIVFLENKVQSFKKLHSDASNALHSAKIRGKNCFVVAN